MSNKDVDVDTTATDATCDPDGGNCFVDVGDRIKWKKKVIGKGFEFRLIFREEPFAGIPRTGQDWPFGSNPSPEPGTSSTTWGDTFTGTVAIRSVFKYTVEVRDKAGTRVLDPMIIVKS
jgi:hypothetical protein